MDIVSYSFSEEQINELTRLLDRFVRNVGVDIALLSDEGGRLITFAPQIENLKALSLRSAVVSAAVSGALEYLENFVDQGRTLYVAGVTKSVYMLKSEYSFLFFCSFPNKIPIGSVKLFSERLIKEISPILRSVREKSNVERTIKFEDIAI
ncbi:MAG: hypothetical protein ABWK04_01880 [Hydrogenobacter sp.]